MLEVALRVTYRHRLTQVVVGGNPVKLTVCCPFKPLKPSNNRLVWPENPEKCQSNCGPDNLCSVFLLLEVSYKVSEEHNTSN